MKPTPQLRITFPTADLFDEHRKRLQKPTNKPTNQPPFSQFSAANGRQWTPMNITKLCSSAAPKYVENAPMIHSLHLQQKAADPNQPSQKISSSFLYSKFTNNYSEYALQLVNDLTSTLSSWRRWRSLVRWHINRITSVNSSSHKIQQLQYQKLRLRREIKRVAKKLNKSNASHTLSARMMQFLAIFNIGNNGYVIGDNFLAVAPKYRR